MKIGLLIAFFPAILSFTLFPLLALVSGNPSWNSGALMWLEIATFLIGMAIFVISLISKLIKKPKPNFRNVKPNFRNVGWHIRLAVAVAVYPIFMAFIGSLGSGASMFDESQGSGAALWLLMMSVPLGVVIFVVGEIIKSIRGRKPREEL